MASTSSNGSSRRLASRAALATLALATGYVAVPDQRADACGWSEPLIEELTTFDPAVAADTAPTGLQYDPFVEGFGGPCEDCARTAMASDWAGYFGNAIPAADWDKVLLGASAADLTSLRAVVAKGGTPPRELAPVAAAVSRKAALRDPVVRALDYVALARRTEAIASFDNARPTKAAAAALVTDAQNGLRAAQQAKDAFLAQRFAFQRLRILFYLRDWTGAIGFFDKSTAILAGPSADLAARARYYVAGALRKKGNRARANLELARVHTTSADLAAVAAQDFQPMEDRDWKATLAMAKDLRERTQLWRLVGLKVDGLVAAQEIVKLDPTSDLIGLLVVRELARVESNTRGLWGSPDPAALAASQKAASALEQLATSVAANPRADRPWLMQLVAGHLAARRGDLATARQRLNAAVTARPGDAKVAAQASASLAMAIAQSGPLSPALADELARTMTTLDPAFTRFGTLTSDVRSRLAAAALKDGRVVDAEFLMHGSAPATQWADVAFLKQMIARTTRTSTAFDRFVLAGSHTRAGLEQELALRYLLDGNFAAADQAFASKRPASTTLGTDPFITHMIDCHDCDHDVYGNAPWTHASFVARVAVLAKKAGGKGQAAADAALELGNAFYNITWYGNARSVLESSHQSTLDTTAAARWYQRAFDLSSDREFKAQAAFYAAKAEMAQLITKQTNPADLYNSLDVLPVPAHWYPIIKTFADTRYYQEILKECGSYRNWAR